MKKLFFVAFAALVCLSFAFADEAVPESDVAEDVVTEETAEGETVVETDESKTGPCPPAVEVDEKNVSFGDYETGKTISGAYVVLPEDEVYDEGVMATGAVVEVRGHVRGDLVCFAAEVHITGIVDGNLMVGAGTVIIDGVVNGSTEVFCASAKLNGVFNGPIEVGSASARLNGVFNDAVETNSAVTFAGGTFNNGLSVESANIYIRPGAVINGDLDYSGDLDLADTAMISGETREIIPDTDTECITDEEEEEEFNLVKTVAAWLGWRVFWFLSTMLTAFLLFLIRPTLITIIPETMRSKPWQSPLAGIGAVFAAAVVAIVLFISVIGIPSWFIFELFALILIFLSWIWAGTFIGNLIFKPIFKEKDFPVLFASALGIFILVIFGGIPILKILIHGLVIIFGWGAFVLYLWDGIRGRRAIAE
ncbi:MAG: polymer-forming cytoskeletal protein [bacterium]|nr:polymer-forming cytoskeletal protein [bacterium]